MTNFVAVGYEWREVPGADNASVELEVIGEIEGLFVWAAAQPAAVDRPGSAKVFRRGMAPQITVGAGKLWVKASGDRNCYIDYDILAGGAGGVDTIARAMAQVPTGEPNEPIGPGEERIVGGHLYTNPTAATINVPATTAPAAMVAAGFTEITGEIEVQLVPAVPNATGASPKVVINTTDGRSYYRDDLGGGVFVYTETRTNPAPDEVVMVNSIPAATSASPELIINRTDGKAYYLDDLGGGVYVYTQVSA